MPPSKYSEVYVSLETVHTKSGFGRFRTGISDQESYIVDVSANLHLENEKENVLKGQIYPVLFPEKSNTFLIFPRFF